MSTSLKALVSRKNIVAADVVVDPNTKNRYFTETLNLTELANLSFATIAADGVSISESYLSNVDGFKGDSLGISESIITHLTYQRQFSDSFQLPDSLTTNSILRPRDTVVPEESITFNALRVEADSFFMDQNLIPFPQPAPFDTPIMLDVFDSLRTYYRDFTDTIAIDEFLGVDSVEKNTTGSKQNIFGFTDSQIVALTKPFAETPTLTETAVFSSGLVYGENIALSETFAPIFTFDRTHVEAVSISESAALQTAIASSDNTVMSDSDPIFDVAGNYQDTAIISESYSQQTTKSLTDSATMSDSISTQLTNLASAVFNTTPLNLTTLNN